MEALKKKMEQEKILILFTSNQMVSFKNATQEVRIEDLSSLPDTVVTHEKWVAFGKAFIWWMPICLILTFVIGILIWNFVAVLIFALVALFVGLFSKTVPDYASAMRLTAAAAIPTAVIVLFLPPMFGLKLFIWCAYVVLGAYCARKEPLL